MSPALEMDRRRRCAAVALHRRAGLAGAVMEAVPRRSSPPSDAHRLRQGAALARAPDPIRPRLRPRRPKPSLARRTSLSRSSASCRSEGPIKYGEWYWDEEGVPPGPLVVTVDLDARVISVFRGGYEIGAAAVLLGTDEHPTPPGVFPILSKERHNVSEEIRQRADAVDAAADPRAGSRSTAAARSSTATPATAASARRTPSSRASTRSPRSATKSSSPAARPRAWVTRLSLRAGRRQRRTWGICRNKLSPARRSPPDSPPPRAAKPGSRPELAQGTPPVSALNAAIR